MSARRRIPQQHGGREHYAAVQLAMAIATGQRVVVAAATEARAREQYEAAQAVLKRWTKQAQAT